MLADSGHSLEPGVSSPQAPRGQTCCRGAFYRAETAGPQKEACSPVPDVHF